MRFVAVKSVQQQAALCVHRLRQGVMEERTAVINRLRGLLTEFGVVAPLSPEKLRRELALCQDPEDLRLPVTVRQLVAEEVTALDQLDACLASLAEKVAASAERVTKKVIKAGTPKRIKTWQTPTHAETSRSKIPRGRIRGEMRIRCAALEFDTKLTADA